MTPLTIFRAAAHRQIQFPVAPDRHDRPDETLYRFTVEDTTIYAEPFSAEFVMHRTTHPELEYACHEGNYSMTNMLQAGRVAERRKAS